MLLALSDPLNAGEGSFVAQIHLFQNIGAAKMRLPCQIHHLICTGGMTDCL